MPDVLTPGQRSLNMSRIRGRNTSPERIVRAGLKDAKITDYRIHSSLPGKPDIVFPKARLAVFIDGCFWHRCPEDYQEPDTRKDFWRKKIAGNVLRDRHVDGILTGTGWTVMRIWEHDVKARPEHVIRLLAAGLKKSRRSGPRR
ncbi:MAG: very short patch repair endonuclease [archaeon]|nr:MAG: very short patch repair endonuclease [archaeon]